MSADTWPRFWAGSVLLLTCIILGACAPKVLALAGTPSDMKLPIIPIDTAPQLLHFKWNYRDETFGASGDGAVRLEGNDKARLDFFLNNGMAGGYAILLGDSLFTPGGDFVKRLIPPAPLLWASLGRLALPALPDTIVHIHNGMLLADIGDLQGADATASVGRAWRVAVAKRSLARVERIERRRVIEWVELQPSDSSRLVVRYVHEQGKRRLTITITDTTFVEGFDAAIWQR